MSVENEFETIRELATHANEIKHLQDDMDRMVKDMEEIKKALIAINTTLSEARGGWRTMVALGTLAGFLGAGLGWFFEHLGK
jgi:hypothetical protein